MVLARVGRSPTTTFGEEAIRLRRTDVRTFTNSFGVVRPGELGGLGRCLGHFWPSAALLRSAIKGVRQLIAGSPARVAAFVMTYRRLYECLAGWVIDHTSPDGFYGQTVEDMEI